MRTIALTAFIVVALFFILRPIWLKFPELKAFAEKVDVKQLSVWSRVRVLMKGVKTIVWGRFVAFAGPLLAGLQFFDFLDFTAILPPITAWDLNIPPTLYVPVLLTPLVGYITNVLRHASDGAAGVNTFVLEPEKLPDVVIIPNTAAADPDRAARIAAAHAVLEAEGAELAPSPPAAPVDVDAPSTLVEKIEVQAAAPAPPAPPAKWP